MIDMDFESVLRVCVSLSTEKDRNKLLDLIITEAMKITNADAGTLYTMDDDTGHLCFKIMRNQSLNVFQGGSGEDIDLPPVPLLMENVCAYCAIMRKSVNIPDVYYSDKFDFSGPKHYDKITGYRTQSMLVVPFVNSLGDVIGVLQLINSMDKDKNVVPFNNDFENIITALASQAAVAVTNALYLQDIKDLFQSFVQVMITAIDEMSPYNVNHTRKITEYAESFIDYLNQLHETKNYPEFFDDERREQLVMGAWMHDVGKLVTPLEVMNKATRLADRLDYVLMRFDAATAMVRISLLEGSISEEEYNSQSLKLSHLKDFVHHVNTVPYISNEDIVILDELFNLKYTTLDGKEEYILSELDKKCLSVRRGTLTDEERAVMQGHVMLTSKLLSKIKFGKTMSQVPKIASMHHEFIDGSGYPNGLKGDELPTEVRILSILDIFEALTSADRPYKKTMPRKQALKILRQMVSEGKLDGNLVELFAESLNK